MDTGIADEEAEDLHKNQKALMVLIAADINHNLPKFYGGL